MSFLSLFITLSGQQAAGRMRIWRSLRALGCATLRDGVYLLPDTPGHAAALQQVMLEAQALHGTADLFALHARDEQQQQQLLALFDRSADYAQLLANIANTQSADAKILRSLRRELHDLIAIDFYPGEAQRQTEAALAALESAAQGEPSNLAGKIHSLTLSDYQNRSWATRKNMWVDRMASAWLIQRFIDPHAKFLWLDNPAHCPRQALGFDFDGAAFTHLEGLVTFEVLAASFGLTHDHALARIAAIVHFLDVGGVPIADAPGIEAVLAGARTAARDDDQLLLAACSLFDHLYTNYQKGEEK